MKEEIVNVCVLQSPISLLHVTQRVFTLNGVTRKCAHLCAITVHTEVVALHVSQLARASGNQKTKSVKDYLALKVVSVHREL